MIHCSPDQIHCLQSQKINHMLSHYFSYLSFHLEETRGYGNVKWRKCDGWQWYDFNDCVPWNIFLYTRNTSRIVGIVSVLGYQAFSGLRWQCLDDAPCLTVLNISLKGLTMARVCWWLSRAIYDTCGSCGWCHDNVTRGHRELTPGPVDNERGSHPDWSDPTIIYYPTLTVGILHKSLRSHRRPPSPSRGAELSVMVRRYTGNCF